MGKQRHTILLVEDDKAIAVGMQDQLDGMGYDSIHVTNQADAIDEVKKGGICLVLLDLEIPTTRTSIKADVTTGTATLKQIRKLHPERTNGASTGGDPKPRLQVLILSGHVKARNTTAKLFQMGAQDVLVKPIRDNDDPFDEILSRALRASERTNHTDCQKLEVDKRAAVPFYDSSCCSPTATEHAQLVKETTLLIDLKKNVVFYHQEVVPIVKTLGKLHMTPQYFNVLTVLAMHPGQFILDVDLEKMLKRLRWLNGRGGLGEKRLTKKRMKDPLVAAVKGLDIPKTELDSLIGSPRGVPKLGVFVPNNSVRVIEFDASGL